MFQCACANLFSGKCQFIRPNQATFEENIFKERKTHIENLALSLSRSHSPGVSVIFFVSSTQKTSWKSLFKHNQLNFFLIWEMNLSCFYIYSNTFDPIHTDIFLVFLKNWISAGQRFNSATQVFRWFRYNFLFGRSFRYIFMTFMTICQILLREAFCLLRII